MRRFFFSLLVVSLFTGMMGCHHIAGVCDCTPDDEPCAHRAPWVRMSYPVPAPQPLPQPLPQAKEAN